MKKNCEFCQTTFEATRSDSKYCSKTCKQEAYLARNYTGNGIHLTPSNSDVKPSYTSRAVKNVNDSITLSRSEFNRLLQSNNAKAPLDHLLNEKDLGRNMAAENSSLKIELKFLEKELVQLKEKIQVISTENTELNLSLNKNEESTFDKLLGMFMENAETTVPMINGLIANIVMKSSGINQPGIHQTESTEAQFNPHQEEESESIESSLIAIQALYPEKPISELLGTLVKVVQSNKAVADSLLI